MRLSAHYELQSMAYIGRAQAISKTDQSGYALGTAMHLGQQAIEMQLKSIMLRLDETLKLGSADKILRSLSHEFYPRIYEVYHEHLEKRMRGMVERYDGVLNMDLPRRDAEMYASYFREVSEYWERYRRNRRMQNITWQYSMGVRLCREDLELLGAWHGPNADMGMGEGGRIAPANAKVLEDRIRIAILYADTLAPYRLMYAEAPPNLHIRKALADTFGEARACFMPGVRHLVRSDYVGWLGRDALLEFGFRVMGSTSQIYLLMYPHGAIGRYPEVLDDGRATPEIYKSRVNNVLFCLFAVVPHHLEQLRENSGLVDRLAETGRRLGYWE